MTAPETLAVLDDDNTRQRLVEALAYAGGIRREDVPKVSAEARNRWHILADAVLVELRILSDGLAEAALARVRELHERWPIHGDGDHPEDCDCGDPWMTVCRLCCTDGKDQHETCAAYHDHGPDKPICPTIAALDDTEAPARPIDPRDLLAEALARPIDRATFLGTTDPQEGAPR